MKVEEAFRSFYLRVLEYPEEEFVDIASDVGRLADNLYFFLIADVNLDVVDYVVNEPVERDNPHIIIKNTGFYIVPLTSDEYSKLHSFLVCPVHGFDEVISVMEHEYDADAQINIERFVDTVKEFVQTKHLVVQFRISDLLAIKNVSRELLTTLVSELIDISAFEIVDSLDNYVAVLSHIHNK